MKMRNKRKQFWWTWACDSEIVYPTAFGTILKMQFNRWKVSRIKHQQKDKLK
jgi:hypothetical protein